MKRVQKSKESESTPSIGSKIKTFLIKTFFVALVIGVAFGAGTFKPNFIIVKQIQQDEDWQQPCAPWRDVRAEVCA